MLETIKYLLGLQAAATTEQLINGTPVIVTPPGFTVTELNHLREEPTRIKSNVSVHTLDSLGDYLLRYGTPQSAVFLDLPAQRITAILDYHAGPIAPGWAAHRAIYQCPTSLEWDAWSNSAGKAMAQTDFALFLERNAADVVTPTGADMLTMALSLKAQTNVKFESAKRLDNGQTQFVYHEEVNGSAGPRGEMRIPDDFTLGIPVHQGGQRYEVPCKLRYRVKEGVLSMWYDITTLERIRQDAFQGIANTLTQRLEAYGSRTDVYWAAAPA